MTPEASNDDRDPFDLARFFAAQEPVFSRVIEELQAGHKTSHWMWFVFPQIAGLGHSPTARHFALRSLAEAYAYLKHPILGPRIERCTSLVNEVTGRTASAIFGAPDDLKFRSSMTLFDAAAPDRPLFREALARFFEGKPDPATIARLS